MMMSISEYDPNVSISKVQRNMVGRTTASLGLIDLDNDAQITEIAARFAFSVK